MERTNSSSSSLSIPAFPVGTGRLAEQLGLGLGGSTSALIPRKVAKSYITKRFQNAAASFLVHEFLESLERDFYSVLILGSGHLFVGSMRFRLTGDSTGAE